MDHDWRCVPPEWTNGDPMSMRVRRRSTGEQGPPQKRPLDFLSLRRPLYKEAWNDAHAPLYSLA
jgi:hypothetical protein